MYTVEVHISAKTRVYKYLDLNVLEIENSLTEISSLLNGLQQVIFQSC